MARDAPKLETARAAILARALEHVPFDGWTEAAIAKGARDAGVEAGLARLAFPDGPADLARAYAARADARMLAALDAKALEKMRIRERIAQVLRLRLEQAAGEREAVRALMAWLALPGHQGIGARLLYDTVDEMWRAIGDTATDFSFYTKRATLAAVLGAVVLYWLADDSEDFAATEAFLERRLDDVMGIEKAKARARGFLDSLPDPFGILRGGPGRRRPPPEPPGAV